MGLIPSLMSYIRQSDQDEENKRQFDEAIALKREIQAERVRESTMAQKRREDVISGVQELAELDNTISDQSFQKNLLEQRLNSAMTSNADPMVIRDTLKQAEAAGNLIKRLENIRKVKDAELTYRSVDAGFAKAKALDLADVLNGVKPSNDLSGMATVKRKQVVGTDADGNDIEEVVTFKAPASNYLGQASGQATSYYEPSQVAPAYMAASPVTSPLGNATPSQMTPEYSAGSLQALQSNVGQIQPADQEQPVMPVQNAKPQQDLSAMRNEATQILNNPNIPPEKKQKVRDRLSQFGITL